MVLVSGPDSIWVKEGVNLAEKKYFGTNICAKTIETRVKDAISTRLWRKGM